MRDLFNAAAVSNSAGMQSSSELTQNRLNVSGDAILDNGDSGQYAQHSNTLARHQATNALSNDLFSEDLDTHLSDPENKKLYFKCKSQEEEILRLRQNLKDACDKEAQLLREKHIQERMLCDLRMALDDKQKGAISEALKQLNEKKSHIEENLRLTNDIKVAEEDVYTFTSLLTDMLAEHNIYPSLLKASTIVSEIENLYRQMHMKIRLLNENLGDVNQATRFSFLNNQNGTLERQQPAPFYMYSSDQRGDPLFNQQQQMPELAMTGNRFIPGNYSNWGYATEPQTDADNKFYLPDGNDHQDSALDDDPLPGIEHFQIIGEPRPGYEIRACGFPTHGTTLCIFQWVRYLDNGTPQPVEAATLPDYLVTADDVGTVLAVDCTPIDDNSRQGELVSEFANGKNKISCDPDMQSNLDSYLSTGSAIFDLLVLPVSESSDEWVRAFLILKRPGYRVMLKESNAVLFEEAYSHDLYVKITYGKSAQFILVSSGGINLPFNTEGMTDSVEGDLRCRDLIVLAIRNFCKAFDTKRKGKAHSSLQGFSQ